jgi:hypothetical protein
MALVPKGVQEKEDPRKQGSRKGGYPTYISPTTNTKKVNM